MNKLIALLLLILLSSCSASWHLKQAIKKGALTKQDTVYIQDTVIVKSVKKDSIFKSIQGDTVRIEKERLKIKYVKLAGDSVFIQGECESDTVIREIPVTVNNEIKAKGLDWKWLIVAFVIGLIAMLFIRK